MGGFKRAPPSRSTAVRGRTSARRGGGGGGGNVTNLTNVASSSDESEEEEANTTTRSIVRGRGRGRGGRARGSTRGGRGGRGRGGGRKGKDEGGGGGENDDEEERSGPVRRHVLLNNEDEDEDIMAAYKEEGGWWVDDIYVPPIYKPKPGTEAGERLVVENITCTNFKSYGGVKTMGPFHRSLTAIVGPNGNGKSNLIDAMLFVFGYRASKIRCKKVSVLIHKSEILPNVDHCSVSVHFIRVMDRGDENIEPIPGTQTIVKRVAFSNNESYYEIDGKKVSFQQVALFLKKNGVDIVHNRFLILQGEVESISQMPPKQKAGTYETGLLEFLEDVIGTRRYLPCLAKLEDRVIQLNFERESKLQAVDLIQNERAQLLEPLKEAKKYLKSKNEVTRKESCLLQVKVHRYSKKLEVIDKDKVKSEREFNEVSKKLSEIKGADAEREKIYLEKENEAKELGKKRDKVKSQLDKAEREYSKNKESIQTSNGARKKAKTEIESCEKELSELEKIPINNEKNLEDLKKRKGEIETTVASEEEIVEKEIDKMKSKIDKLSKEKGVADQRDLELRGLRDEKKNILDRLNSELNVYKEKEGVERRTFETLETELHSLRETLKARERDGRSSIIGNIDKLKTAISLKEGELAELRPQLSVAKQKADEAVLAFESAKEALEISSGGSTDNVLKLFEREKKKGRLQGVYGRMRDLATIDEKYNIAATVAHGLWDHWIVDTPETGAEAIRILKENNLGVQNFQCLDKLGNFWRDIKENFTPPRRTVRLFDLLKLRIGETAPAFYKGCRNTLVAETLAIASELAYKEGIRAKFVTLKGEVIDPSGSMTGGGLSKIVGKLNKGSGFASSVTVEEVRRLESESAKSKKEYESLLRKINELEAENRSGSSRLNELSRKLESAGNVNSIKNQIELKEKRVEEQRVRMEAAVMQPKVLKEKEKGVKEAENSYEAACAPVAQSEKEVNRLKNELKFLQVDKKKEIRRKLDSALGQLKKVNDEIERLGVELKNYPKTKENLEKKITSRQNEKTKLENRMKELDAVQKEIQERSIEMKKTLEELSKNAEEARVESEKLKKSLNENSKERVRLEKERVTLETELGNIQGTFNEVFARLKGYKDGLSKLELVSIMDEVIPPFVELTPEEMEELDTKTIEKEIRERQGALEKLNPRIEVIEEYKEKTEEFLRRVQILDGVTVHRDKVRQGYLDAVGQRLKEFLDGFVIISSKLKEMFRMISMGGDAEMELIDSSDPYSMGINLCVRPAKKSWKKIAHLSGGEKTLASLALVFALHHYKPSPFYVMDEIDAALDFKNVSIIANYIKDRTKFTQFMIISLRANMFELADSIIGVFKVDNMSYSMHLGIELLLTQMRTKYEKANRPFPLENDYRSTSRSFRRGEREKALLLRKKKAEKAKRDEERFYEGQLPHKKMRMNGEEETQLPTENGQINGNENGEINGKYPTDNQGEDEENTLQNCNGEGGEVETNENNGGEVVNNDVPKAPNAPTEETGDKSSPNDQNEESGKNDDKNEESDKNNDKNEESDKNNDKNEESDKNVDKNEDEVATQIIGGSQLPSTQSMLTQIVPPTPQEIPSKNTPTKAPQEIPSKNTPTKTPHNSTTKNTPNKTPHNSTTKNSPHSCSTKNRPKNKGHICPLDGSIDEDCEEVPETQELISQNKTNREESASETTLESEADEVDETIDSGNDETIVDEVPCTPDENED